MEINFPKLEKKTLKFWKENGTFERSIQQRKKAPNFVFYEGPPTVNAKPGIHHILSRVYKDVICRYKTMRGFRVLRKAGWDTHGLPVELEIEKKLGLKNKKDIEKYGIAKFNRECKKSAWLYQQDWEKLTERIGFWLDMENPYITYQPDYIETVWWILKQIHQKGLMYQDYKVVPYCPRCGTSLSSHEVALGYKKVKEKAVYIKFKIDSKERKWRNTAILSWTTTPWTLPGNVALAINPELIYLRAKTKDGILVLAKTRLKVLGKDYQILEKLKGKDLVGLKYKPLFKIPQLKSSKSFQVYPADFVTAEEGTGVVHTAVMYGEEDYALGKAVGLPTFHTVTKGGRFIRGLGEELADRYVKDGKTEFLIAEHLRKNGLLFSEEWYEHDYPFCWRCNSPLLYYAKQSWFINVQKVKKDLIKNNQRINWTPAYLKEGRFGEWLREVKDWAFSRERYWGTPLPIWRCGKCGQEEVVGSKKDLLKQKFTTNKYYILRHGQTVYQTKNKGIMYPLYNEDSVPLTRVGEKQVGEAAKALRDKKIDLIYASDLFRTRKTAEIIAKVLGVHPVKSRKAGAAKPQFNGVKIIFDRNLRDVSLGIYSGGKKEDFYKKFPRRVERFYDGKPAKGESWGECRKRIIDCLYEIDRRHQNKTILIVSHGDPLWLLEGTMKGWTDRELIEKKLNKKMIHTGEFRKIELKKVPLDGEGRVDFHRPYIDRVEFYCPKCSMRTALASPSASRNANAPMRIMKRVPEVIDCWLDAGSMPLAQYHYPFQNKALIEKKQQFPADYISEAVDQTRGWFYTLLAISTLLGFGFPYKNVISVGHVLDEKGEKMSKSKGNVVDPWYIVEKYGADAARWYFYTVNQPGDAKLFSEKDIDRVLKGFIMTLWNSFQFLKIYKCKSKIQNPKSKRSAVPYSQNPKLQFKIQNLLDKWIVSRLNELILETTQKLDRYDVTGAARAIENFVISDLSLWYIRRSRRRFQKPSTKKELEEASAVLGFVFQNLCQLTAPFVPFLSEEIYQKCALRGSAQSVHLQNWPKVDRKLKDDKLEKKMKEVRKIVAVALAERAKSGIKVRQPLLRLKIKDLRLKNDKELLKLIEEELNVKEIVFNSKIKKELELDTRITPELKEEGMVREVLRHIQEMRKIARFKPRDRISIRYSGDEEIDKILSKAKDFILKETKAEDFKAGEMPKRVYDIEGEIKISQKNLWLGIKKQGR